MTNQTGKRGPRKEMGHLKQKSESLLIGVQNNAKKTNLIKARIDKAQQNSSRLCGYSQNDQSHSKRMQQISTERV